VLALGSLPPGASEPFVGRGLKSALIEPVSGWFVKRGLLLATGLGRTGGGDFFACILLFAEIGRDTFR
jgi:hypothetical protein